MHLSISNTDNDNESGGCIQPVFFRPSWDWTPMANSRFWANPTREPRLPIWLPWLSTESEKCSSPSRDQRNQKRLEELTPRQRERIRIMSGAFDDQEVDEKVALSDSKDLDVGRGDVLVGQGGKYLHPRLFKVI